MVLTFIIIRRTGDQLRKLQEMFPFHLPRIPPELRDVTERLLSEQPAGRPEAASLLAVRSEE